MYSTHNEEKPVIAKRFLKTLKATIYNKVATNASKSYLSYFNKLVDEYTNTHSVNKKLINTDYSVLIEKNWKS